MKHLKPGGIALHTTELNLTSNEDTVDFEPTVLFRVKDIQALTKRLIDQGYEIDLNFDFGDACFDQFIDVPPYSSVTHLKLKISQYISTSYGLAIKKPISQT